MERLTDLLEIAVPGPRGNRPGVLSRCVIYSPLATVLRRLVDPVVLFVHHWELCDFRHDRRLRIDCPFNTGATAVECLREAIRFFKVRGDFRRITRLVTES